MTWSGHGPDLPCGLPTPRRSLRRRSDAWSTPAWSYPRIVPSRFDANWLEKSRSPQPWIGRGRLDEPPESQESVAISGDRTTTDPLRPDRGDDGPGKVRERTGEVDRTSRIELALLVACVMLLTFDDALPLGPVSWSWVAFGALGLFELLRRPQALVHVGTSGPMLRLGVFLALALAFEARHASDSLLTWVSVAQMAVGLAAVAVAVRDERAVRTVLYGFVAAGLAVAVISITGDYSTLSGLDGADASQVSAERMAALRGTLVDRANINSAVGIAAIGATIALGSAATSRSRGRRIVFTILALLLAIGVTVSASRGAMMTLLVGAGAALLVSGRRWVRSAAILGVVAAVLLVFVPSSAFSRFESLSEESSDPGQEDPRVALWEATLQSGDKYLPFGVGVAAYSGEWGRDNGFAFTDSETGKVVVKGTHNVFTQVLIWWGIPTLAAFCWFLVDLILRVTRNRAVADLRMVLVMTLAALVAQAMVSHTLHDKTYSMVLGMALGYVLWLEEPDRDFGIGGLLAEGRAAPGLPTGRSPVGEELQRGSSGG